MTEARGIHCQKSDRKNGTNPSRIGRKNGKFCPPEISSWVRQEGVFMKTRARAPRSIKIKINPWKSNETLEEVTQKAKFDRKMKKIGHRGKQGKKKGEKKGRAGRPDAARTSGEKSTFEKYEKNLGRISVHNTKTCVCGRPPTTISVSHTNICTLQRPPCQNLGVQYEYMYALAAPDHHLGIPYQN